MEKRLKKVLLRLGITSKLRGFHYILKAVELIKEERLHRNITEIYETVAEEFDTNKFIVERSIRSAMQIAYNKKKTISEIYGYKPDNSSFLYDLVFNLDVFEDMCEKNIKE